MKEVRAFTSENTFTEALLTSVRSRILKKNREGSIFRLALSGGSTPQPLYQRLGESTGIDWSKVELYLVDERCVSLNDERSNAHMISETLVSHIQPKAFIHFDTSKDHEEALSEYEQHLNTDNDAFFDLILLGMGADGHTASLFPQDPLLAEKKRWVGHSTKGSPVPDRLTLTYPALKSSHEIFVHIKGAEKRDVLEKALTSESFPISKVLSWPQTEIFFADC